MANFQVKSDLPLSTQNEINRISAIASAQRTSVETAFLASLSDYLYNTKDLLDENGLILVAGVRAESVLTVNTVLDGQVFVIGAKTYRAKTVPDQAYDIALGANDEAFIVNAKKAVNASGVGDGTDYFAGTLINADVVATTINATTMKVVGRVTGTSKNAIVTTGTESTLVWADTTLGGGTGASNAGIAGHTVTVDSIVYTIVTDLSESVGAVAVPNEVLYGSSDATALDNLLLAINAGATEGTNYSTGTEQPTSVTATTNTNTTQKIEAVTAGVSGDDTCAVSATGGFAWDEANVHDGVDGTVAKKGQQYINASYIYTAVEANTITGKNWRRVSLGTAY